MKNVFNVIAIGEQGMKGDKGDAGGPIGPKGEKGDLALKGDKGDGNVIGPGSSSNRAIAVWNGVSGDSLLSTGCTVNTGNSITCNSLYLTEAESTLIYVNGVPFLKSRQTNNLFLGDFAGGANLTTGGDNCYLGRESGYYSTLGTDNVAVGSQTLLNQTTGSYNIGIGRYAGGDITTGSYNIVVGVASPLGNSTGNIWIGNDLNGDDTGDNVRTQNDNILICSAGVTGVSGQINIGNPSKHTSCYIRGIHGVIPSGTLQQVTINSNGQLGSQELIPFRSGCAITWKAGGPPSTITPGSAPGSEVSLSFATFTNIGGFSNPANTLRCTKTTSGTYGYFVNICGTLTTYVVGGEDVSIYIRKNNSFIVTAHERMRLTFDRYTNFSITRYIELTQNDFINPAISTDFTTNNVEVVSISINIWS
jgi:hypothetical protein